MIPDLWVVVLHSDDPAPAGGGVLLDGGHVQRLDGEGVHHANVHALVHGV